MNSEQQELLDEVFENYRKIVWRITNMPLYTKEEFINKCKTNTEFSEKWGLKIEERELSLEERYDLIEKDKRTQFVKWESLGTDRIKEILDKENIPTKLITITYNDKTIESYE
jgi:hypothetical protein